MKPEQKSIDVSNSAQEVVSNGGYSGAAVETAAVETAEQPADNEVKPAPKKKFLQRNSGRGAAGTQVRSQQPSGKEAGLLPFLKGTGVDCKDRNLDEILSWDFDRMEKVHDYVQWLFPTDEASRFNMRAPLLTVKLQQDARGDPEVQAGIRRSLAKFCSFLGLELKLSPVQVLKAAHFDTRAPVCWNAGCGGRGGNHNWLHIPCVLHCLKLTGCASRVFCIVSSSLA
eukprot:gnl/MRDRNA2_/MRDRNA2_38902_c0_seq1.p1 gnl/MRDRNA2_/MRDRNA2_38902_c0~~gnl/MRDRNA2_/MRDRNA2_38902_c0_seq1.p1  ORF type:complete len:227 (-),score=47.24 gnl/MRDRNA2_/MRDRNA2_38902_c0_seq1:132-812(-)